MAYLLGPRTASSRPRAVHGSRRTRFEAHRHVCKQSIRDFIRSECPLPGIDGRYKEQPKDFALELAVLPCSLRDLACPGQRRLFKVSEGHLDAIIADSGQVPDLMLPLP
jgi:hypothetical protein